MSDERTRWSAWKEKTFGDGYLIWHDGLPVEAVTARVGPERDEALAMLRLGLSLGDVHAAQALAAMGDAASVDGLRAQLGVATGAARVSFALALHALAPDAALASHLADVLRTSDSSSDRLDAARGLREFSGQADETALLDAVADPDYLVRYHAASSLLARLRVEPYDVSLHAGLFPLICDPPDPARLLEARRQIERMKR